MNKLVFLLFLCLQSIAGSLCAQGNALLWKISGKGLSKPSYLFGTIHQICTEDYFWTDTMQKYFHRTEQLCLELDMDDPLMSVKIAQSSMSTDGKTLKDYLTPKEYARLATYIKEETGQGIEVYNRLKPIWVVLSLSSGDVGCETTTAYETRLMDSAGKYKMNVTGLETVEEQMNALNDIPNDKIKPYILDIIDGRTEQNTSVFKQMVALYKAQDIEALYRLINAEDNATMSMDKLLDGRNRKWISRIAEMAREKSTFFAVGAGHLGGSSGVIALLRKDGFTVEPLK
ncbi:TraB/GumN family protein [Taibaiella sp. KBW10]|uniref:TraB/GumN family protein n=1 Tax=Taibaiella sp. KBW10 TaxID=2153357 RepID=UPI000F5AE464|nr:TraB/GumN family protein [Taibaiella sp. KBW10]RQO29853.1 TraB/GumN family protein [Taibaiella sp. KBW10]